MACPKSVVKARGDSGVALIVVLLLVAILSVAVAEFLYEVRINAVLTGNNKDRLQASYVAKAGVNAAKGLLKHSAPFDKQYRSNFQNQFIQLFHCECVGESAQATLGLTGEQVDDLEEIAYQGSNCGLWSMDINYPVGDSILSMRITDEQTRLNLNAFVRRSSNAEDDGVRENPLFRPILLELFKMRLTRMNIEYTEDELEGVLDVLGDWLDYGTVDGTFDSDLNQYYEQGDNIYSNKNGPMDTVSELKMIPFITDEIYNAVKDFVTVYPWDPEKNIFSQKVNIHLAGREVLYALFMGASYEQGRPKYQEEELTAMVNEMIENGMSEEGFLQDRQVPSEFNSIVNTSTFQLNPSIPQSRFYRVYSSGMTSAGIVHTIETVIRVDPGGGELTLLYWRED